MIGLRVYADSVTALGICRRSGIGRVRHLATGQLWVQESLRHKDFLLHEVLSAESPAGTFSNPVPKDLPDQHLTIMGLTRSIGRTVSARIVVSSA